jgi:transcriptional regulator with XRE-family HTH domain
MNATLLTLWMKARRLNQADLARTAGVSRQAVARWFRKTDTVQLRAPHFMALCERLGVPPADLTGSAPELSDANTRQRLTTVFLWDHLFPTLEDFIVALARFDERAAARYIQVQGLFAGDKIWGKKIWAAFPRLAPFIHPARRAQLEVLWTYMQSQTVP